MADGIARVLFDEDGNAVKVYEQGGDHSIAIQSVDMIRLLVDIKQELRLMNIQLRAITDLDVNESNLEGSE